MISSWSNNTSRALFCYGIFSATKISFLLFSLPMAAFSRSLYTSFFKYTVESHLLDRNLSLMFYNFFNFWIHQGSLLPYIKNTELHSPLEWNLLNVFHVLIRAQFQTASTFRIIVPHLSARSWINLHVKRFRCSLLCYTKDPVLPLDPAAGDGNGKSVISRRILTGKALFCNSFPSFSLVEEAPNISSSKYFSKLVLKLASFWAKPTIVVWAHCTCSRNWAISKSICKINSEKTLCYANQMQTDAQLRGIPLLPACSWFSLLAVPAFAFVYSDLWLAWFYF